jgi:hypothetical protein
MILHDNLYKRITLHKLKEKNMHKKNSNENTQHVKKQERNRGATLTCSRFEV